MQLYETILLVEDDKYIALALKIRLEAEGYCVRVATDVKQALDIIARQIPDVAVIDHNLPDGNGIDLIEQITNQVEVCCVALILMTASKQSGLRERALSKGATQFLEKPFKSSDLVESIKSIEFNPHQATCCQENIA